MFDAQGSDMESVSTIRMTRDAGAIYSCLVRTQAACRESAKPAQDAGLLVRGRDESLMIVRYTRIHLGIAHRFACVGYISTIGGRVSKVI